MESKSTIFFVSQDPKTGKPVSKRYVTPRGEWMLVEMMTTADKTEGGLHLPDSAVQEQPFGIVQAVGDGVNDFEIGDVVFLSPIGGVAVRIQDKTYQVVREEHIVAAMGKKIPLTEEEVPDLIEHFEKVRQEKEGRAAEKASATKKGPQLTLPFRGASRKPPASPTQK